MILNNFTIFSSATLGTTATQVTLPTPGFQSWHIVIINPNASAIVGFEIQDSTLPAPTVTAVAGDAACGSWVLPNSFREFDISSSKALYVVASAVSSQVVVQISKN